MQTDTGQQESYSWVRTVIIGRNPKLTFIRIAVLVATCLIVFKFILLPIRVDGPSMLPTYRESSVNFVSFARADISSTNVHSSQSPSNITKSRNGEIS